MGIGHGKVILLGEHGVVYGRPALAASLGVGCRASAVFSDATSIRIESEENQKSFSRAGTFNQLRDVELFVDRPNEVDENESLRRAFAALLDTYPKPMPHLALRIASDLPGGAGLGCSAALAVAATRAIDSLIGISRDSTQVAEASMAWERIFHGNPSGIDSAVAARGGIAVFYRGRPLEMIDTKRLPLMVIGHSGESASTRAMVEKVALRHARFRSELEALFDEMADLVIKGRIALETGDIVGFGELMNRDQVLLDRLQVSTPRLEEMCAVAREAGALGAKLTGGGGGGCMIALVADEQASQNVMDALKKLGYQAFTARVGVGAGSANEC
ncbi:MAG: mevalonate kinase [Deltaproteobacteria bacterium]|nr:mevalonate kinase [Deltaproteobacteria bacterium]